MKLYQLLPIVILGVFSSAHLAAWGDLQDATPHQTVKPVAKQATKQAPKRVAVKAVKTAAVKTQPVVQAKSAVPAAASQPAQVAPMLEALPLVDAGVKAPTEVSLRIAKKRAAIINHKKQQHSAKEPEAVRDAVVATDDEPVRVVGDFAPMVNHKKQGTVVKKKKVSDRSAKRRIRAKKHTAKKKVLDE